MKIRLSPRGEQHLQTRSTMKQLLSDFRNMFRGRNDLPEGMPQKLLIVEEALRKEIASLDQKIGQELTKIKD